MRLHLETGNVKELTGRVWITGWIVKTDGTNDGVLRIEALDGPVTPSNGYTVPGTAIIGQVTGLSEDPEPTVTIRLTGTGAKAVVFYKRIH